jgi:hypothetical protein
MKITHRLHLPLLCLLRVGCRSSRMLWTEGMYPTQNLYVKTLIPSPQIWWWDLWELIEVTLSHTGTAPWQNQFPYKEWKSPEFFSPHSKRIQQEGSHQWARIASSPRSQQWNIGLPASRTMRNKCLFFKPPSLWYSVTAAQSKTQKDTSRWL